LRILINISIFKFPSINIVMQTGWADDIETA